jgi:hypothetical protein
MRGCLFVVVFSAVILTAVTWFAAPPFAAFVVRNGLHAAGFASGDVAVDVSADPPLALLTGRAGEVRIRASDASIDRLVASRLDVRLRDVNLFARSFASVDGSLSDVSVPAGPGAAVTATSVELRGAAADVVATVHIPRATAEALFRDELARVTGRAIADVRLSAPDQVTFSVGPISAAATLLVVGGELVLRADVPGQPSAIVLRAGDPLVVRSVAVADELVIVGTIDGSDWLTGPRTT